MIAGKAGLQAPIQRASERDPEPEGCAAPRPRSTFEIHERSTPTRAASCSCARCRSRRVVLTSLPSAAARRATSRSASTRSSERRLPAMPRILADAASLPRICGLPRAWELPPGASHVVGAGVTFLGVPADWTLVRPSRGRSQPSTGGRRALAGGDWAGSRGRWGAIGMTPREWTVQGAGSPVTPTPNRPLCRRNVTGAPVRGQPGSWVPPRCRAPRVCGFAGLRAPPRRSSRRPYSALTAATRSARPALASAKSIPVLGLTYSSLSMPA